MLPITNVFAFCCISATNISYWPTWTVTLNAHVAWFPKVSENKYSTVVNPTGKCVPGACVRAILSAGPLSPDAVGSFQFKLIAVVPNSIVASISSGHPEIIGGVPFLIKMVKIHDAAELSEVSSKLYRTDVAPIGNCVPGSCDCVLRNVPEAPVAVGSSQSTPADDEPCIAVVVMLLGHCEIVGGVGSLYQTQYYKTRSFNIRTKRWHIKLWFRIPGFKS